MVRVGLKRAADDAQQQQQRQRGAVQKRARHAMPPLRLTADATEAQKDRVYAACEKKRKNGGWAKCPKIIHDCLIERMLLLSCATPNDVFLDIGSGIGNVVESVAMRVGCPTIGVEFVEHNYQLSLEAAPHFQDFRKRHGLDGPDPRYILGDIRKVWEGIRHEPTIIWCSNKLFPLELDIWLLRHIQTLPAGTRIMMWKDLVLHTDPESPMQREMCRYFTFDSIECQPGDLEWTNKPATLQMYTRTAFTDDDSESECAISEEMVSLSSLSP